MRDSLTRLGPYLQKNLASVLAVAVIVIAALLYLVFVTSAIVPSLRNRSDRETELANARQALADARKVQGSTPDQLQAQITGTQAALLETFKLFLTGSQAGQVINALYQYAGQSGVSITDLQTQAGPAPDSQNVFFTTAVHLQIQGDSRRLIDFVSRIKEATAKSVIISAVGISNTPPLASMAMDLSLYASNFATGEALVSAQLAPSNPGGPIVLPTLAPATGVSATSAPTTANPENQLVLQLDAAWATQNWPVVINTLEQIQSLDPNYPNLVVKLYAAHVNFGYQLLNAGRPGDARAEFTRALQINPSGGEATAALNQLTAPTATPASRTTTYIVQTGDTLFSIARRFGVALDALMAANGLPNNSISVGQTLIIPLP